MKSFKIASQPFHSLGFRSILRDQKILLFSVVADVLLFFHHYVHKADQTFSVLCPKRPKSSLPVDCQRQPFMITIQIEMVLVRNHFAFLERNMNFSETRRLNVFRRFYKGFSVALIRLKMGKLSTNRNHKKFDIYS